MKFAKELEDDLVPEWRLKYLDYKTGKKKIKAVSRALRNVNRTPRSGGFRPQLPTPSPSSRRIFTTYDFNTRKTRRTNTDDSTGILIENPSPPGQKSRPHTVRHKSRTMFATSPPVLVPGSRDPGNQETEPLYAIGSTSYNQAYRTTRYGSIIGTPPDPPVPGPIPALELPDPALTTGDGLDTTLAEGRAFNLGNSAAVTTTSQDAYHVGTTRTPHKHTSSIHRHLFRHHSLKHQRPAADADKAHTHPRSKFKRILSGGFESPRMPDVHLGAYQELDAKQDEFFSFLDKELKKIDSFYQSKEDEATERLKVLREQLHEMRDRRMEEMEQAKRNEQVQGEEGLLTGIFHTTSHSTVQPDQNGNTLREGILKPVEDAVRRKSHIGKTSKAMGKLGSPGDPRASADPADSKDYVRRDHHQDRVPYRFAKRRLKLALQEFYRGLELLKAYGLLNRTGFRKINKKYDKAVNARPTLQYMNEKVSRAHFVTSNIVEGHIVAVEDLYARYFERGNHKVAVNKLRTKLRSGDQSPSSFRCGLFVAAGLAFGIQGLVRSIEHLFSVDPTVSIRSSYLLQIYGGYFLSVLLFLIFVLCCRVWTAARINYVFIFEYDTRHVLDWRQLAELPCFFLTLNGFFLWLNFRQAENAMDPMYIYWPVLLVGVTVFILFLPLPILYHDARKWFAFSNWRLLLAGLYPVEFRDFYLGDMYCSETYTMSQMEVFFCLYARNWNNPSQCNSSHSALLGFFTTLPAIWRAFQCLRRYYDSRNWFPHLANFAKYCCNIVYYMTLSMYRRHITEEYHAVFITFAAINAIYSSFWDVAMDFSLGNPYASHPFLRENLAYRHYWVYYVAAVLDVILRQQWIFYAIFTRDLQHSSAVSFAVGLLEVLRRGMWSLFRVENEHCNNVGKFRASRDIPLPYKLPESPRLSHDDASDSGKGPDGNHRKHQSASGADLERANTHSSAGRSSLRLRKSRQPGFPSPGSTPGIRALQRVGTVIAAAHAQDFEKKKKPEVIGHHANASSPIAHTDSSDEEGDHTDPDSVQDEENVMEAQKLLSRGQ